MILPAFKNNLGNYPQDLEDAVNSQGGSAVLYLLAVTGSMYESYFEYCHGIKEVLVTQTKKHPTHSAGFYQFTYQERMKTKWSSTKKNFKYDIYVFNTRIEAEQAFLQIQKHSVEALDKRIAYYNSLKQKVIDTKV
jgi:hypothetical protein